MTFYRNIIVFCPMVFVNILYCLLSSLSYILCNIVFKTYIYKVFNDIFNITIITNYNSNILTYYYFKDFIGKKLFE